MYLELKIKFIRFAIEKTLVLHNVAFNLRFLALVRYSVLGFVHFPPEFEISLFERWCKITFRIQQSMKFHYDLNLFLIYGDWKAVCGI